MFARFEILDKARRFSNFPLSKADKASIRCALVQKGINLLLVLVFGYQGTQVGTAVVGQTSKRASSMAELLERIDCGLRRSS